MPTVLYIDDDPDLLHMLKSFISLDNDITLRVLHNPSERVAFALDTYQGVDVCMTDYLMPNVTGMEILQFLHDRLPKVKRVLFSAVEQHTPAGVRELADVVLSKPASISDIMSALTT